MTESPYQTIKRSIVQSIESGHYTTGQVLPSEHDLCRSFGVSRMTVNRAPIAVSIEGMPEMPIQSLHLMDIVATNVKAEKHQQYSRFAPTRSTSQALSGSRRARASR